MKSKLGTVDPPVARPFVSALGAMNARRLWEGFVELERQCRWLSLFWAFPCEQIIKQYHWVGIVS